MLILKKFFLQFFYPFFPFKEYQPSVVVVVFHLFPDNLQTKLILPVYKGKNV